jgi:serine/threonine protein kinase/Tol biopolymer transport system component
MTPERWAQIEELFHSVAECKAEQRGPLLDLACQDDADLRREVDALLSSDRIAAQDLNSAVREGLEDFAFPRAGQMISHFRILNGLGGGGMGLVYRAEDLKLGRQVALKFLPEESDKDPAALGRFEREARSASSLEHPNICPIYEFGEHDGQPFLVMQLLEGRTLQELISETRPGKPPFSVEKLVDLAIQIAGALEAAHTKRIIHRDIKPSNIFITSPGEPKILDFGLAKLFESDAVEPAPSSFEAGREWNPDVTLTRAGTAIGTAAYMSPEQIRGEKLDARTDLFSFGLVLYEMATGQRAFSGETEPQLRDAILSKTPSTVRQLNHALPARLETIVKKATEKSREARYQSAADMRRDLEALQKTIKRRSPQRFRILAAGVLIALLGIVTSLRMAKRQQPRPTTAPHVKLRQITFNSFENRVTSGAISPDGKFVAYADVNGMYVMTLQTGETRLIPEPGELRGKNVQWEIDAGSPQAVWFGDSASFVANAHLSTPDPSLWGPENTSVWVVNALHGAPHKIRENSVAYAVASIRNQIAFTTREGRELWVMGPSGNEARKIVETSATTPIIAAYWSPDARQLIYGVEDHPDSPRVLSRDLQSGAEIELLSASEIKKMQDITWLPDGRMLYSVGKDSGDGCDHWTMRRDFKSGKTVEAPKQITNWSGFCMSGASVTADGRELVFLKTVPGHMTSYVAEISEGGRQLRNLRHFPLSENSDAVIDWMADNKEVLTVSNREGTFGIYKLALDSETARPIVTEGYGRDPHLTPDGKWILYFGTGNAGESIKTNPQPLMRVSVNGGAPQRLMSPSVSYGLLSCARAPARLCVIARPTDDRKQLIISSIDPLRGIGPELMRFPLDPNRYDWFIALSSDGTRLAVTRNESGPIYTFLVSGKPIDQINVKNWSNLFDFAWAVDGRGLYVVALSRSGHTLLYVDLHGNASRLWESSGATVQTIPILSPDGRQIAVETWTTNSNLWMTQNFE